MIIRGYESVIGIECDHCLEEFRPQGAEDEVIDLWMAWAQAECAGWSVVHREDEDDSHFCPGCSHQQKLNGDPLPVGLRL